MRRFERLAQRSRLVRYAWDSLMTLGLIKRTRDLSRLHRALQARAPGTNPGDDLTRAVERVRQLVGGRVT
jgi:hypothetical protein